MSLKQQLIESNVQVLLPLNEISHHLTAVAMLSDTPY